jgi:catechol 2,3-dioxygenase-like lactoylglutathione lyase family enzyme
MRLLLVLAASAVTLLAQLSPPNGAGVSMGHIHLMVRDPEVQKKLWIGILGAEVTHAGSLELLRVPGAFIIIGRAPTPPEEGTAGSSVNHIGFLVKSYADTKTKLADAGLALTTDNPQGKQIIVKFPDKVDLEFIEDPTLTTTCAMHHIHAATLNVDAIQAWDVKTLGATAGKRASFVAAFIPGGEIDYRLATQAVAPTRGRSLDHIGFEVRNLEAFCKKLAASGAVLESPYREMPQLGGLKIAFLVDPDGTRIELTEGLAGR